DALVERTAKLKVGNGMEAGIDIGPAIDKAQLETDLRYIETGKKEAKLQFGGRHLPDGALAKGYFVEPTIFTGVEEGMTIAQEEIFGPVLAVMKARDFDHSIQVANNVAFV